MSHPRVIDQVTGSLDLLIVFFLATIARVYTRSRIIPIIPSCVNDGVQEDHRPGHFPDFLISKQVRNSTLIAQAPETHCVDDGIRVPSGGRNS